MGIPAKISRNGAEWGGVALRSLSDRGAGGWRVELIKFSTSRCVVIRNADKLIGIAVRSDIAGAGIAIPRLSD